MSLAFTKMHGLGNDFMVVPATSQALISSETISRLADRRTGIGFDQLLWLEAPKAPEADVYYRIFNADGSEAEQCGNGARCIARLLADSTGRTDLLLEHSNGLSAAKVSANGRVSVAMGEPDFRPSALPFTAPAQADAYTVDVAGEPVEVRVVSMGNPHAVVFVDDIQTAPVAQLGPALERHERFPNRANIGFAQLIDAAHVRLRVYERGVGETQGCGTGACAAMAVGRAAGRLGNEVEVALPGGLVTVAWAGAGQPLWLTGEAICVFEGTVNV